MDEREEERRLKYYSDNTDEYIKAEKKFEKLLKKGGYI